MRSEIFMYSFPRASLYGASAGALKDAAPADWHLALLSSACHQWHASKAVMDLCFEYTWLLIPFSSCKAMVYAAANDALGS